MAMPGWHDCGQEEFGSQNVGDGAKPGHLVEHAAPGAEVGSFQGTALCALGSGGASTRLGIWTEGLHLGATDAAYHSWASYLP